MNSSSNPGPSGLKNIIGRYTCMPQILTGWRNREGTVTWIQPTGGCFLPLPPSPPVASTCSSGIFFFFKKENMKVRLKTTYLFPVFPFLKKIISRLIDLSPMTLKATRHTGHFQSNSYFTLFFSVLEKFQPLSSVEGDYFCARRPAWGVSRWVESLVIENMKRT